MYRNGLPVQEAYASHKSNYVDSYRDNFPSTPNVVIPARAQEMLKHDVRNGELVVPDGQYFVLGDNRDNSLDSRYWGFISRNDIVGRPVFIYASYDEGERPAAGRRLPTLLNTRWGRLFKLL